MLRRTLTMAAILTTVLSAGGAAQDAASVVAAAAKAMGADTLTSITYSGTRAQRRVRPEQGIGEPMGAGERHADHPVHAHHQLRAADRPRGARVARDRPDRSRRSSPGVPPQPAGVFNQNITRHAGGQQLDAGAQYLDDAVGIPEGRGGEQRHRAPAGRAAGRVVLAGEPQVAVGTGLHRHRLHQQPATSSPKSRRASRTRWSATCSSSSSTRTTRT